MWLACRRRSHVAVRWSWWQVVSLDRLCKVPVGALFVSVNARFARGRRANRSHDPAATLVAVLYAGFVTAIAHHMIALDTCLGVPMLLQIRFGDPHTPWHHFLVTSVLNLPWHKVVEHHLCVVFDPHAPWCRLESLVASHLLGSGLR